MTVADLINLINNSTHHKYLYHFTDELNFPSIAEKGLLSKAEMRNQGWWPNTTGGNSLSQHLDINNGVDPYVSLCMTRNHSMEYLARKDGRLPNSKYLAISPDVLNIPGVLICFGVANANNAVHIPIATGVNQLDTEVIYKRTEWRDPNVLQRLRAAEKFEILVPSLVPRNLIMGVF